MRIAVLADIHGNLPALRSVLGEMDREPIDAIVVPGDVVGGPMVAEVLELIDGRREPAHWVSGNGERERNSSFTAAHRAIAVGPLAPASTAINAMTTTLTNGWS